jgi:sec-independent protein translocase protein TatB
MLDFGFSEILLTSAIALVVLGPERLPKVARRVGNWMGRARLMARQLSEQLEREVNAEELLKEQTKLISSPERAAKSPPTASASTAAALSAGASPGAASSAAAPEQITATDPKHP